jgi:acid phosphatase family membrane protein YuiD
MPSAHTAFAFSIATVVLYVDGLFSVSFVIAAAVVIFIIDDALRMRVFLGRQAETLHVLVHKLSKKEQRNTPHLETRLGHTFAEVVTGAVVGVVLSFLILLIFV